MRIDPVGFNLLDTKKLECWHQELMLRVTNNLPHFTRLQQHRVTVVLEKIPGCAGLAQLDHFRIKIDPSVLDDNRFFKETYAHELAHMLSSHFYQKNTAHGKLWREVMTAMHMPAYTCLRREA